MTSPVEVTGVAPPSVRNESHSCDDLLDLAAFVCGASSAIVRTGAETGDSHSAEDGHRLYSCAEIPLIVGGRPMGTLVVYDDIPRALTVRQLDALDTVARQLTARFEMERLKKRHTAASASCRVSEGGVCDMESRSRAFIDHSPAVAFMKDCYGRYVYVNRLLCERFGRPEEEWLGRTDFDLFPHDAAEAFWATDCRILSGERNVSVMEALPTIDNSGFHWQSFKFSFTDPSGARFLAGIAVDRTLEKAAEDALKQSEAKLRATINHLAEGVLLVDADTGKIVDANTAVLEMFGCPRIELLNLSPFDLEVKDGTNDANSHTHFERQLTLTGRCELGRRRFRAISGRVFPAEVRVTQIPGDHGMQAFVVRDLTHQVAYENRMLQYQADLESANARLRQIAITDPLTGVKNRALFDERIVEEYERAVRYARPLSVILLDVDHFKQFNDSFGHLAGDETLRAVAARLASTARSCDVVARYGGEEFAVILPDADRDGAMVLAERCRRTISDGPWSRRPIAVSLGVATMTPAHTSAWQLIEDADTALYESKARGRNCVTHAEKDAEELACL
jgi:diguanylate cyclase (GGDEF)-like protein/PAS domain S-box-containing protein